MLARNIVSVSGKKKIPLRLLLLCVCATRVPHSSSSRPLTPMQGPGCCVLSKTRLTVQETAGIPIWSPSDSCSAYAASAQRCCFKLPASKHLKGSIAQNVSNEVCLQCGFFLFNFIFQKGHVKCNTIKCPALSCENPVAEPQRCCPKCSGPIFHP